MALVFIKEQIQRRSTVVLSVLILQAKSLLRIKLCGTTRCFVEWTKFIRLKSNQAISFPFQNQFRYQKLQYNVWVWKSYEQTGLQVMYAIDGLDHLLAYDYFMIIIMLPPENL